jgi:hypothetical protein
MPSHPGKLLIIVGVVLVVAGGLWLWAGKLPLLGRLPGDLRIERENFSFYFPLGTCLLISIVLSFVLWLLKR